MHEVPHLLELAKAVAAGAGKRLTESAGQAYRRHTFSSELPKEIKACADAVLDEEILAALRPTGLTILSEESGLCIGDRASDYYFIVDPLDGTFNFVRNLGDSAVSIALWKGDTPVFGVLYTFNDGALAWGGPGIGAFINDAPITVSKTAGPRTGAICTGFPVRADVNDSDYRRQFWEVLEPYAKVRMLGAAAVSLLNVARGAADAYMESGIMLWDVAAGLAIVEGAGGRQRIERLQEQWCCRIFAANDGIFATHAPF